MPRDNPSQAAGETQKEVRKAAKKGEAWAQFKLGVWHAEGSPPITVP